MKNQEKEGYTEAADEGAGVVAEVTAVRTAGEENSVHTAGATFTTGTGPIGCVASVQATRSNVQLR